MDDLPKKLEPKYWGYSYSIQEGGITFARLLLGDWLSKEDAAVIAERMCAGYCLPALRQMTAADLGLPMTAGRDGTPS